MKPYVYLTCCVDSTADKITDMVNAAVDVTYNTFRRRCDPQTCDVLRHYERDSRKGLTLKNDSMVTYHASYYAGVPCYFVQHSRIEFIWVRREDADRLRAAGEKDEYAKRQTAQSVPARRVGTRRLAGRDGVWLS